MSLVQSVPAPRALVLSSPDHPAQIVRALPAVQLMLSQGPLLRVAGSAGGGGSGGLPPHLEPTPKTVWSIAHNLGYRPSVTVTDLAGAVVLAEVRHLSVDVLQIAFVTAQAGRAYLV